MRKTSEINSRCNWMKGYILPMNWETQCCQNKPFSSYIQIKANLNKIPWWLFCVWNMTGWFKIYVVVQSLSHVWLFAIPWTATRQASLSITNSQSLPKLMSIESVMPSNYLIFCCPLLLLPSTFPSIRVFSNKSALHIRWQSIGASAQKCIQNTKTKNDQGS